MLIKHVIRGRSNNYDDLPFVVFEWVLIGKTQLAILAVFTPGRPIQAGMIIQYTYMHYIAYFSLHNTHIFSKTCKHNVISETHNVSKVRQQKHPLI